MLTNEAFNALLKTLEEPPEHVKFIFCTTEAEKIPITILSRCQRFDFAGVQMAAIVERLRRSSGRRRRGRARSAADPRPPGRRLDARQPVAAGAIAGVRRSRRSRSPTCTRMLGTAGAMRGWRQIVRHLAERDAAAALAELDAAVAEGVDVGQLLDQLLGYFRDLMVAVAGCPADALLYSSPGEHAELRGAGRRLGIETILAMMQILDQTIARLRYSTHPRTLAELALVRICTLGDTRSVVCDGGRA